MERTKELNRLCVFVLVLRLVAFRLVGYRFGLLRRPNYLYPSEKRNLHISVFLHPLGLTNNLQFWSEVYVQSSWA